MKQYAALFIIVSVPFIFITCAKKSQEFDPILKRNLYVEELVLKNVQYSDAFVLAGRTKFLNTLVEDLFLEDVVDNKSKIFLRIPPGTCELCLLNEIELIKKEAIDSSLLVFVFSDPNVNSFRSFVNMNLKGYQVLNLFRYDYVFPTNVEQLRLPYYFIVSNNFECNNVYISLKELPEFTSKYLRTVSHQILMSNDDLTNELDKIFYNRIIDVGMVAKNSIVKLNIPFVNTSDCSLVIEEIRAECGCVVFKPQRNIVEPGERSFFSVEYTGGTEGQFYKQVYLKTSLSDGVLKFIIHGTGV